MTLYTSLAEIKSFGPCAVGWRAILKGQGKTEADDQLFPIANALESNSVSDVLWLLGKRGTERKLCAEFAKLCADSVAHLTNQTAYAAAARAATYTAADADAAADAAAYAAADAAIYATYAAARAAAGADADAQRRLQVSLLLRDLLNNY